MMVFLKNTQWVPCMVYLCMSCIVLNCSAFTLNGWYLCCYYQYIGYLHFRFMCVPLQKSLTNCKTTSFIKINIAWVFRNVNFLSL